MKYGEKVELSLLKEQNPWWQAKENIATDVQIEKLARVKYKWNPTVIKSFNLNKDVIYTLRGSRQIGKTTLLKLLVEKLLKDNQKENMFYFTCNNIDDYKGLIEVFGIYFDWIDNPQRKYIFIDEITFVKEWTRAVKHLADIGKLKNCTLILTGSNAHDLKYEIERMPGRRGEDADLDKIMFPVSFREYVEFENKDIISKIYNLESALKNYPYFKKDIAKYLYRYLLTGGFIQAINAFALNGKIEQDIYQQYLSWILGDLAKMGRKEIYSRQIFGQVIKTMTTNIGFDTIARKTSIESHLTVGDYLDVMESSFIVKILYQVDLNKKLAATRRTKKIYFQDMFLFWVFLGYVYGLTNYFLGSKDRLEDDLLKTKLIEQLVMSHLARLENSVNWSNMVFFFRSTNQVEVDFVVRRPDNALFPIEVKYKNEVTPKDFIHLNKINNKCGIIVSKDTLVVDKEKLILPAGLFLLLQNVL